MRKHTGDRTQSLGFVVIGRNEGDRLKVGIAALRSLVPVAPIVYVDSGSTDGSLAVAKSHDAFTVALDDARPFTAARARNEGFARLLQRFPNTSHVQFIDGDCELQEGWPEAAMEAFALDDAIGIVSGQRVERHPDASIFNTLMDIEWQGPPGDARVVLGDMCVSVECFRLVGGFAEHIIAAEDDDFCLRARQAGFRVLRDPAPMTLHDANITRLSQWLKRARRGGHGYAEVYHLHRREPERHFRRELARAIFWGGVTPLFLLRRRLAVPAALLCVVAVARVTIRRIKNGDDGKVAVAYAVLTLASKPAEFVGVTDYHIRRIRAREQSIIEYK